MDAVVAQPLQPGRGLHGGAAGGVVGAVGAHVLHADQDREVLADLIGQLGVEAAVVLERGPLAAALALEELVGHRLDGVAIVASGGGGHGWGSRISEADSSSREPGPDKRGPDKRVWGRTKGSAGQK